LKERGRNWLAVQWADAQGGDPEIAHCKRLTYTWVNFTRNSHALLHCTPGRGEWEDVWCKTKITTQRMKCSQNKLDGRKRKRKPQG